MRFLTGVNFRMQSFMSDIENSVGIGEQMKNVLLNP